ncbi:hypothetical protein [uncultured Kordia sp.]|uniref:hypothetical protein n=1 Tax=uncultured Kordia sp. TaxID=507699 RepID=UPI00260C6250|nr:hypothetical protein [uncultured Kordia sp.]
MKISLPTLFICFFVFSKALSQVKIKGCYQPPILPIEICVDDNGNVSTHASSSFVTPIGVFKAKAGVNIYENEAGEVLKYESQINNAVKSNPEIRYVTTEKIVEIPKFQYKLYLKYNDEIHVYQIKSSNELRIETSSGFKGKFSPSIIEIELSDDKDTRIYFNSIDVNKINTDNADYPTKRKVSESRSDFEEFHNGFMRAIGTNYDNLVELPKDKYFSKVEVTNLTKNPMGEPMSIRKDYYMISDEDFKSRKVFSIWSEFKGNNNYKDVYRVELYYNKSTYNLTSYDRNETSYINFLGINIHELLNYLLEQGVKLDEDQLKDLNSKELYPGFSTTYKSDRWRIGLYSRFNNDITDMIAIFPNECDQSNFFRGMNNDFENSTSRFDNHLKDSYGTKKFIEYLSMLEKAGAFEDAHNYIEFRMSKKHRQYFDREKNWFVLDFAIGNVFLNNLDDGVFVIYDKNDKRIRILFYDSMNNLYRELFGNIQIENWLVNNDRYFEASFDTQVFIINNYLYNQSRDPSRFSDDIHFVIGKFSEIDNIFIYPGNSKTIENVSFECLNNIQAICFDTDNTYNCKECITYDKKRDKMIIFYSQSFAD